jgi:hypothetical protein
MKRNEGIRSLGGPGGLTCPCCGGSRKRTGHGRAARAIVKAFRRVDKARAIREGVQGGGRGEQ